MSLRVVLVCSLLAAVVRAQPPNALRIETIEYGPWPNAVAALQSDRGSEGRSLHVTVLDDLGRRAPCGSYMLNFDVTSAIAFQVVSCDPADASTLVTLISRPSLFVHDGPISRPRAVQLVATEVRTGSIAGGAALTGGSALTCTVGVRPYLDDLEHGMPVYLPPDRYALRVSAAGVSVENAIDGWVLRSAHRAQLVIEYDVIDRATGEIVLHDHASLACGSGGGAAPTALSAASPTTAPIASVGVVRGAAQTAGVASPLSEFDDELSRDSTTERPSAWVQSRVSQ